jgi:hypothetical protein
MRTLLVGVGAMVVLASAGPALPDASAARDQSSSQTKKTTPAKPAPKPEELDKLFAPVALYPDPLLAQMLMAAEDPGKVAALNEWLASQKAKGTELQDAATKSGFGPSYVALVIFPDVVAKMATQFDWTTKVGQAFSADRSAVFASIQRLRAKAKQMGTLKTTAQQEVETRTTSSGEQVIVIEPANPQVVYVPQYNSQVVYTQPATTTVVIQEDDDNDAAVAAGLIGFTAGIAIGAAIDNDYYYGPYGFYGGGYMYNDAWDDYYDHREDAREDWMDHREDLYEERGEQRENLSENRTERAGTAQEQRTQRRRGRRTVPRRRPSAPGHRPSVPGRPPRRRRPLPRAPRADRASSPVATAGARIRRPPNHGAARARTRFQATRAGNQLARQAHADSRAEAAARAAAAAADVAETAGLVRASWFAH